MPGVEVHAGEGPVDDMCAIAGIAESARGRAGRRVRRHRDAAGGARRPARRTADRDRHSLHQRAGGAAVRLQDPWSPGARRIGRLALPRRASSHRHVPRRTQDRAGRPAQRRGRRETARRVARPAPPAEWREELDYKAGHWRRMLALMAMDRERGEPAPPREVLEAAPLPPDVLAELAAQARERARRRRCAAARRHGPHRRPRQRLAPALAVLGPPRLAGGARARRGRGSSSTTRTGTARVRGQGERRLLHDVLRLAPTRATSRAGRRDAG